MPRQNHFVPYVSGKSINIAGMGPTDLLQQTDKAIYTLEIHSNENGIFTSVTETLSFFQRQYVQLKQIERRCVQLQTQTPPQNESETPVDIREFVSVPNAYESDLARLGSAPRPCPDFAVSNFPNGPLKSESSTGIRSETQY